MDGNPDTGFSSVNLEIGVGYNASYAGFRFGNSGQGYQFGDPGGCSIGADGSIITNERISAGGGYSGIFGAGVTGTTLAKNGDISSDGNCIIKGTLSVAGGFGDSGLTVFSNGGVSMDGTLVANSVQVGGGYNNSGVTIESDGDIFMDGTLYADGNVIAYYSSDRKLKLNVNPIETPLDKILQIGGYSFDWDETKQKDFKGHDVGVIAQEIQKVLPEVVQEKKDGYLGVRYEKIVPLLIEGIKELSQKVDELEKKLNDR
jgi:hypothetical protein